MNTAMLCTALLLGLPLLGDYLDEGLSQFDRSCSDETDTR